MKHPYRILFMVLLILASVFHDNADGTHAFASYIGQADTVSALAGPDTVKIRNFDVEGEWASGYVVEKDLNTSKERSEQIKNGIATFDITTVDVEEYKKQIGILAGNPIEDYAELRIETTLPIIDVEAYNSIGQLIGISQDNHLSIIGKAGPILFRYQDEKGRFYTHKAILQDGTADISIITEANHKKGALVPKTHAYTFKDSTNNFEPLGIEVNLDYFTGQLSHHRQEVFDLQYIQALIP